VSENERLKDIQVNIAKVQEDQARIMTALFGDKEARIEGVFEKVDKHDKDIRKVKMLSVFAGGALMGWPAVWEGITKYFSK
jgi:hypothetical protein